MLKVALEIMLSQKIAHALFALMVFASQSVIGRPSPNFVDAVDSGIVSPSLDSLLGQADIVDIVDSGVVSRGLLAQAEDVVS